jgi:hypothetical protein
MKLTEYKLKDEKSHFTSFNLNNFKMFEAMELKLLNTGHLKWHHFPTAFHENLPSSSKAVSG